ncbi:MAG: hypothetical protein GXY95_06730 [Clostridiales bacterium]|jgi:predicted AlkP superfamily pyrophosphatase or phosphodiesterase|nr:hypothetical protein [Clostridiales bacterium]HOA33139.1 alkaline phosphatase family protein [Clostridiales bacterium]HQA04723.1 alkaline phosphatase family protein [Clostridiales bacterium]HQD72498.1 alkaline phosphatase family protein [Clostridiales bacterium]HXK83625.1 alkaline phosphatase family protein [Clostridiales bacterium]
MDYRFNSISLTRFASTICALAGIEKPEKADEPVESILKLFNDAPFDRIVIHNPDAVAMWLYQQNFELFEKVLRHAPVCLPFKTVFPSVTPVCFGTMYTGALPEVHGIQFYTKPVIKIDSVYDAFIGAGKKAAIVAVRESSMSKIFLERDMDYFIEEDDEKVKETAIRLIKENKYNLLSVYTQEYDDVMHARGVLSPEAINALKNQIRIFDELANAIKETERDGKTLITFSTDHGVHNEPNGRGSHGTDEPYDLNIAHFFGVL